MEYPTYYLCANIKLPIKIDSNGSFQLLDNRLQMDLKEINESELPPKNLGLNESIQDRIQKIFSNKNVKIKWKDKDDEDEDEDDDEYKYDTEKLNNENMPDTKLHSTDFKQKSNNPRLRTSLKKWLKSQRFTKRNHIMSNSDNSPAV
jgi:hypothetical protein